MKPAEEQTILVTGATDGIGRGAAEALTRHGATVILHGRDAGKLADAAERIAAATGAAPPETVVADFASLAEVRRLADDIANRHGALDVLVNNAGIGKGPHGHQVREESADGHELRFQVNYLAPFLLARRLVPALRAAAPARVVNVASIGQEPIDFDDVMLERRYDAMHAYCQSKLALVMASFDMAAEHDPRELCVNALHPGTLLDTKMVREGFGSPQGPVEKGIDAEVRLATDPELDGVTGEYFDVDRPARAHAQAYDDKARAMLREITDKLLAPHL